MALFQSSNSKTEIFICIGKWCPTGCQSCWKAVLKNSSYSLSELKKQIDVSHGNSDEKFSYFLYGTNNISHPEIKNIIQYLIKLWRNYRIQLPLSAIKEEISDIIFNGKINEFVVSQKISSIIEVKEVIKNIKEFYKMPNIIINYDLLIDLKFIPAFEKILQCSFKKNNDNTFSAKIANIHLNFRELYIINYRENKIDNLWITSCFSDNSFDVGWEKILIHDHYEIDENLDIMFHNPLCFIGNNKVSNWNFTQEKIIKNFTQYKNHYLKELNNDFPKTCFSCISNGFQYNKN